VVTTTGNMKPCAKAMGARDHILVFDWVTRVRRQSGLVDGDDEHIPRATSTAFRSGRKP